MATFIRDKIALCGHEIWTQCEQLPHYFCKLAKRLNVIYRKTVTVCTSILPNACKWVYRVKVEKSIHSYPLKVTVDKVDKVASLYLHGKRTEGEQKEGAAVLMLHGVQSHPLMLLPLADAVKKAAPTLPLFSLKISYEEHKKDRNDALISEGVAIMEGLGYKKIVVIGHSYGAIHGVYRALVKQDARVIALISIAGRLRVIESEDKPCEKELQPLVNQVYQQIQTHPAFPLYQIVPGEDELMPYEASAVRPDKEFCSVVPKADHLNILYWQETASHVTAFLCKIKFS
jgi:hypothetical protein